MKEKAMKDENSPLVSIIIPCRNEEKFIENCVDSIIAQDYPKDREHLFVTSKEFVEKEARKGK